jgi:hypothetical protein
MRTIKCKIVDISDFDKLKFYLNNWTYAFHRVFKDFAIHGAKYVTDKEYRDKIKEDYGIGSKQFESMIIAIKMRIEQANTIINNLKENYEVRKEKYDKSVEELLDLQKIANPSKKEIKKINDLSISNHKKKKTLEKLSTQIKSREDNVYSIVFGGKGNLRKISYLNNLLKLTKEKSWYDIAVDALMKKQPSRILSKKDIENKITNLKNDLAKLPDIKNKYIKQRNIPYYSVGSVSYKDCNYCFEMDLDRKFVIFKPNGKENIKIEFSSNDKELRLLNNAKDSKQLPITVTLSEDFICFSYNPFELHHKISRVDKKNYINTKSKVDKEVSDIYKKRSKKYYAAVDLNPAAIGFSIIKKVNKDFVVVKAIEYDFSNIKDRKNKKGVIKNEIEKIYQKIFEICDYYNVRYFTVESSLKDLSTKGSIHKNKKINKLLSQVWHKNKQLFLCQKWCDVLGIEFKGVYSAYSSTMGNIKYNFVDPINASLEMNFRRAFGENKEYTLFKNDDLDLVKSFLNQNGVIWNDKLEIKNWYDFHEFMKENKNIKYRRKSYNKSEFYQNSMEYNSKIICRNFNVL